MVHKPRPIAKAVVNIGEPLDNSSTRGWTDDGSTPSESRDGAASSEKGDKVMDELWDEFFDEDGDAAAVVYWRRGDPPELWPTARAQIIEDERRFFLSEMAMILPDLRWWEGHVARSRAAVREFGESTFWAKALERAVPEMWDLRRRLGRAVKGLRKLERPGYLDKCPF